LRDLGAMEVCSSIEMGAPGASHLKVVVPAGALVLGLGIDAPQNWAQSRKALFLYSHPGVALLLATVLIAIFCWGVVRLVRL
jgi:hypothetical protein